MNKEREGISALLQNKILFIVISVFGVGIITHGYAFFNMLYSTDSMLIYQDDDEWMYGLGRFMMPVYERIRGRYYPPSVVGFLSLFFIAVSVYLIIDMFKVDNLVTIFLVCLIMTTNYLVRNLFDQFMHDADAYLFSCMLVVLGVYLWRRYEKGFIASIPIFICSIGLYPAYLQVAVTLFIILAVYDLFGNAELKDIIHRFILQMLGLIFCTGVYFVMAKLVQRQLGIADNKNANSIGNAFRSGGFTGILKLVPKMYEDVFKNVLYTGGNLKHITEAAVLMVVLLAAICLFMYFRRSSIEKQKKVAILFLIAILPAGMECVYVMSGGYFHSLMRHPKYIVFALGIIAIDKCIKENSERIRIRTLTAFMIAFISIDAFVCAGNQYLQKDMVWQTTMFTMTRVIDRLEQTEGYEPGKPVVIVGDIDRTPVSWERDEFYRLGGSHVHFTTSYYRLYERYFQKLLGYPIWILSRDDAVAFEARPEVEAMPAFPAEGCIKQIDDVFVVKISNVKLQVYVPAE